MDRLFVYGSLKAGGSAHLLLNGALAEAGGTLEHVDLIEFNGYPMLRAGSNRVDGEVYRIPDILWQALDAWEEVPRVYQRRRWKLIDGRDVWVYEAS